MPPPPARRITRRALTWAGVGAVGVGLFALVAALLIWLGPELIANDDRLTPAQQDEAKGGVRTSLLALGAVVIALIGAVYTARTFALNRRGQITERFTRAIDQLGSEKIEIRLGGIYALGRIAHESADERQQINEVLTAYIREHSPWPPRVSLDPKTVAESPTPEPPTAAVDIKAIMNVLARRDPALPGRWMPIPLDLAATNLREVWAGGIYLGWASLAGTQLQGAILHGANLEHATLDRAVLHGANLKGARLHGTHLRNAELCNADLEKAHLAHAHLDDADLTGVAARSASFERAYLKGANFTSADIGSANLAGASCDRRTRWPKRFDWRAAGVRNFDKR